MSNSFETWSQTFVNYKFNPKLGLAFDMGHRRSDKFINHYIQGFIRLGATYFWGRNNLTLGLAFFETNGLNEIRPYQRLTISQQIGKLQIMHRYRLEQRFRQRNADMDMFNLRFGYQFNVQLPLTGDKIVAKTPFLIFQDEVFLNFATNTSMNRFDQNRVMLGLGYQLNDKINLALGYQYIFFQLLKVEQYSTAHTIRLNLTINLEKTK